jgi:peptidoglycan hydrolase-like protein with peptidoglycan-binding domain
MKLIISESEKNRILAMHNKVRNLLFEAMASDKPNWSEASNWIKSQPNGEIGVWPPDSPDYKYAKYKNYQGNFMEIQNNGNAMEHKNDASLEPVHSGTWSWNGSKVIFSWMQSTSLNWDKAKEWLLNLPTTQPNEFKEDTQQSEGIWNDYEWARVQYKGDNPTTTHMDETDSRLEIMNNGKAQLHYYDSENIDLIRYGKWKWDGSSNKVIFDWAYTKTSSGQITNTDTDKNSLTKGNKLMNIGSKGELVKWVQHLVTPDDTKDWGTGMGCHDDVTKCDGIYGKKTKELVKNFQKIHGLHDDGIVGSETARYMKDYESNEDEQSPGM